VRQRLAGAKEVARKKEALLETGLLMQIRTSEGSHRKLDVAQKAGGDPTKKNKGVERGRKRRDEKILKSSNPQMVY